MFYIIEKECKKDSDNKNCPLIIGKINDKSKFVSFLTRNRIRDLKTKVIQYENLKNVKNKTRYNTGFYLVDMNDKVIYLKKTIFEPKKGIFKNKTKKEINILKEFTLIKSTSEEKDMPDQDETSLDRLERFHKINPIILIVGRRGSGRSQIIKKILDTYGDRYQFDCSVIDPKLGLDSYSNGYYDYGSSFSEYSNENLENILKSTNECVVLDDCLGDFNKHLQYDITFKKFMVDNSRLRILTFQFADDITEELEKRADFIIFTYEDSELQKKDFYQKFGKVFPSYSEFDSIFNATINSHTKGGLFKSKIRKSLLIDLNETKYYKGIYSFY